MTGTAPGNSLTPFFVNLGLDELGPVDTLRLEAIVTMAQHPKISLLVTAIDRKGPLMLDLESRSGATPRPVWPTVLALVARSLEDALAYLGGNVAGLRPRPLLSGRVEISSGRDFRERSFACAPSRAAVHASSSDPSSRARCPRPARKPRPCSSRDSRHRELRPVARTSP